MKTALAPLALAAAFSMAACTAYDPGETAVAADYAASPASAQTRDCFWSQNVSGYTAVDDDTVNLRVGVNEIWQLDLFGPCPDIEWSEQIGIQSRGAATICSGLDATIIAPSTIGPRRCPVRTVRKLTPDEVAALAPGTRP